MAVINGPSDGALAPAASPGPGDALRAQAAAAARGGRPDEAERLLRACVAAAPDVPAVRHELALMLFSRNRLLEAVDEVDAILVVHPSDAGAMFLKASILIRMSRYHDAIALYRTALEIQPEAAPGWLSLGHALKTAGDRHEAVAAYRRALEIAPDSGEAWWSLADLKVAMFGPTDVAAMTQALQRPDLPAESHCRIHYALGKAKEDAGDYAGSFAHYAHGARLRRRTAPYDADRFSDYVARAKALFTRDFFAQRAARAPAAQGPIFVVGLPRSGSTLVEQILASHSQVEGLQELSELLLLAGQLDREAAGQGSRYPESLSGLTPARRRKLGRAYLDAVALYRCQTRPLFVDKMPENFMHVGLIDLILPGARIVDVRRHPLGCGFSVFKQHFARGHAFSNDLTDIGRHYADYADLMAHFDDVLPGRVHRVIYERLVADPEAEVRRLLDYCGLPFEPGCLRFHENARAVRTPSSEQVRRPIFTDAVDHWRNYEPWLGPLKAGLGRALEDFPGPIGG